jgi:predicted HTH domain antitoxin
MAADVVLEVRFPEGIYDLLRAEGADEAILSQEAREGLALRLYAGQRLSLGKAAELAALPTVQFMELLRSVGLPVVEYGAEQFREDLETIQALQSNTPSPQ